MAWLGFHCYPWLGIISVQLDSSERGCLVRLCFGFSRFQTTNSQQQSFMLLYGHSLIAFLREQRSPIYSLI